MHTNTAEQLLLLQNLNGIPTKELTTIGDEGVDSFLARKGISDSDYLEAVGKRDRILSDCDKLGISIVGFSDAEYPKLLRQISNFPPVLYYKGDISILNSKICVAIIGSRKATTWSQKCAIRLAEYFNKDTYCVVSGLAMGCDTAIQSAVTAQNGLTVSILGQGLDKISPVGNKQLAEEILMKGGALISEKPPYSFTNKYDFAKRDRIQSGVSRGVLLIQSESTGGSLITMKNAYTQGRHLAALAYKDSTDSNYSGNRYSIEKYDALEIKNSDDIISFKKLLHQNYCQEDLFNNN